MMNSATTIAPSASTEQSSLYTIMLPTTKRKRRPAGTPDPDAEVVALSPHTLMESDSYVCEICNQGFQRDQNLQMHRRRHKVPWKLLKRVEPEVRRRVYVCPEPSCLHHNPCHALGDMVGIKKHYRRKHSSMKQWECDRCSKAYAVQSDYKAHLKTCGTRGHCCDCGRVFSRIESFIEHQDTCTVPRRNKQKASGIGVEISTLHVGDGVPELQLLNRMSKANLHQVESSDSKPAEDKCIPGDLSYLEMLPLSGGASCTDHAAAPAVCCNLQLSIGMISSGDQVTNNVERPSLHVAVGAANQGPKPAQLDSKAVSCTRPAAWSAESPFSLIADDACLDAEPAAGFVKTSHCNLSSLSHKTPSITYGRPSLSCKSAIDVEPASGFSQYNLCKSVLLSNQSRRCRLPDNVHRPQQGRNLLLSCSQKTGAEAAAASLISDHHSARPRESPQYEGAASSMCKSGAALDAAADQLHTEHSVSSSGSIREPYSALSMLQLEKASCLSETQSFFIDPDASTVPAAFKAAEVFLLEARENLKRASAEKLEAEKAWREARKERELAGQELAKAQRVAEYSIIKKLAGAGKLGNDEQLALQKQNGGEGTRKSTCSSSTSSSPCSSIANTQAPTSFLQMRQVHAEAMVLPTCVTCPTCLHTHVLYP